ncbi:polynucleotide adenylyltransferase PcnB [Aurantivibrio plasticivorans]
MLKSFIRRIASRGNRSDTATAATHHMHLDDISRGALRVISELEKAGYEAYIVGGGVRDLLLDGHPKDFDIATDATPEQTKKVFRNARIVGKRFRIVHVRMGREVLEVTTFRGSHNATDSRHAATNQQGRLVRDNVYGDLKSDALRRDFTMNALYYSPNREEVTDFTDGLADVDAHLVRMIGDPATRYQEDPVRMLRAARLAAKLDFDIETKTAAPITELAHLLADIPPARLFDESLKLLMGGYAEACYQELRHRHLFEQLFPATQEVLDTDAPGQADKLITLAAANTDRRIRNDQRVTPAFIFAVILWPVVQRQTQQLIDDGLSPIPAIHQAAQWVLSRQCQRVAIPKRFTMTIRDIWELQFRLRRRNGLQAFRAIEHPKFRAAYDFLLLREESGESLDGLGVWWTTFQSAEEAERKEMVSKLSGSKGGAKNRSRRRPKKKSPPTSH